MKLSTSIGDIDIEYQFCLRFKNYDFLNHVLTFDFSIFEKPRVTDRGRSQITLCDLGR